MKTLKKSIFVAVLAIGTLTIAQAQESNRKGWDGTVKGKQSQGVDFGQKLNSEKTDETQSALHLSKKGYDYYSAKSELNAVVQKRENNKHPDLMKRQLNPEAVSETVQEESESKIKPTIISSKKEFKGHVSLLK